jgi:hypothetical protein
MESELGRWEPFSPAQLTSVLEEVDAPWWLAGGWALDLFLGGETRTHDDIDVLILRRDISRVRTTLADWDAHAADPPGTLRPWPVGTPLPFAVHDVWCRVSAGGPWRFQLMIDNTQGDDWIYRREERITRPISQLDGPASTDGRRVLAPEIQLLYKSKALRPKDQADFDAVLPALCPKQRRWLRDALTIESPSHTWLREL